MIASPRKLITAIIPVRLSHDRLYDETFRIERIIRTLPNSYEALIVDYGTSDSRKMELVDLSVRYNVELVRVEILDRPFSVGHARDIGTQHAKTPLVMYHDIDFLLSQERYEKVLEEARLLGMPENGYAFFALPGAYLTRDFTDKYLDLHESGDAAFADMLVHDGVMRSDKNIFEGNTYAISAIVASRYHLLAIGGHDKSFTGHGAEDFELLHRLTSYYLKGPRSNDYYKNTKNNSITSFEGFRAFYALYGISVFQRGTVIAHLWHPRRKDAGYVGTDNQSRVSDVMKEFDRGVSFLPPLDDETSEESVLALVEPGTSPFRSLRHAFPAMGKVKFLPENAFADAEALVDFYRTSNFTKIFFLNPYGNAHRLSLYKYVRQSGIPFITYDRGALPDSWFFDSKGFLGESGSYHPSEWDVPLLSAQRDIAEEWIRNFRLSNETLETNGSRIGSDRLRQKLGIGDRKVIFVALQRPSDTATVYFSGPCGSADGFNDWISNLTESLDARRYVVVVKKHPLESKRPSLPNVVFAHDDTHIKDLIELADKVVVINSGTGLIAATLGKPVICCGNAFYCHHGIAEEASSAEHLGALVLGDSSIDSEKLLRFINYLVFDFYSFGKAEYIKKKAEDGSMRSLARKVVYSNIRGLGREPVDLGGEIPGVSLDAPLFYSFGGRRAIRGGTSHSVKRVETVTSNRRALGGRMAVFVVGPFIRLLANRPDDFEKFHKDPAFFFSKLKNPFYRSVGKLLFPASR